MSVQTLIVDDSESFSEYLRTRLERMGCEIVGFAANSQEGLQAFRRLRPSLVTLDLSMPDPDDLTSLGLLKRIRAEAPETAVVVISVHPRHVNGPQFLSNGALLYMEKAFMDYQQLHSALKRAFPELDIPAKSAWRRLIDKSR